MTIKDCVSPFSLGVITRSATIVDSLTVLAVAMTLPRWTRSKEVKITNLPTPEVAGPGSLEHCGTISCYPRLGLEEIQGHDSKRGYPRFCKMLQAL